MAEAAPAEQRRFGKFTLVAKLAQGGMAEIFLAKLGGAAGFEKILCIKRILPEYAKDPAFVSMFLDEAKIAARISHPNVCQVYELGALEGAYYIAMEYLEGVPVSAIRRAKLYPTPPDPRFVVGIAVQACEGLHHAHNLKGPDGQPLGVVHRDISPGNLFVTADGIVKVLDFGIAKIQNQSHKTTTGAVNGTYAFMPPEQLKGEGVDRRSDVFALGAVLWETFARRALFRRDTDFHTFQAICTDPIPDVCQFRPDVPPEIGAVIAKALRRDREARWPTTRAFGEALAKAVQPLGGPLAPSALGDEIEKAFHPKLEEGRQMLATVRAGGELSLEEENAEAFGMIDTPVTPTSALKRRSDAMRAPTPPPSVQMEVALPRRTSQEFAAQLPRRTSQEFAAPRPSQMYAVPIAPTRSRAGIWILLLTLIAAAGGAGAVYYFFVVKKPATTRPVVVLADAAPMPDAALAAVAIDAAEPTIAIDAEVAIAEPDAGIETEPTPDAAVVAKVTKHPPKPPKPSPSPSPTARPASGGGGEPGTITIDSSPVYAVIYIDGKKYGETPLIDVKLSPGRHSVRAVSSSGGTKTMSITIESGKKARGRRIEW